MKIFISIIVLIFSFNFANAQIQDDRYFDSRKIYGKVQKVQKIKVTKKNYYNSYNNKIVHNKKWRYRNPGPALVANAFRAAITPAEQIAETLPTPFGIPIKIVTGSLNGIVAPLAAKATEIIGACGSRIISGVRYTRVAGTRRISLHASGRAVDISGNPSCIYAHLANWPGGYSTDYYTVRPNHVHISYGGSEHGIRFVHNSGKRWAKRRYARWR